MESLKLIIDDINKVLNSKKSRLAKIDRDRLIVIREKLKHKNSKKGLITILKDLFKIIFVAASIYKDSS